MAGESLHCGDVIRLDLTDMSLEARCCPARDGAPWFDEHGEVEIDWNDLKTTTSSFGHMTTRTDTQEGGWTRKVSVNFSPYLEDDSVRNGEWTVVQVEKKSEYEQGPGGNGSWEPSHRPIGMSTWITCKQGERRLRFVCDWKDYYQYVDPRRISVVRPSVGFASEGCAASERGGLPQKSGGAR